MDIVIDEIEESPEKNNLHNKSNNSNNSPIEAGSHNRSDIVGDKSRSQFNINLSQLPLKEKVPEKLKTNPYSKKYDKFLMLSSRSAAAKVHPEGATYRVNTVTSEQVNTVRSFINKGEEGYAENQQE